MNKKIKILVGKELITQKVAEEYEEAFTIFCDEIVDQLLDQKFYPESKNMFRALNKCPDPKVVILGQDPYFDGSAIGLAFDNLIIKSSPSPSLHNILKEMLSDIGDDNYGEVAEARSEVYDSYLGHLPEQGVLLLNTALTVKPKEAGSHTEIWKPFTEALLKKLQKKDNIVWILWGNHAKSYKKFITNKTHLILEGTHPMPLAANRGGFFGGNYFSQANAYLRTTNQTPINW